MPPFTDGTKGVDQLGGQMLEDVGTDPITPGTHGIASTALHLEGVLEAGVRLFYLPQLFLVPGGESLVHHDATNADDDVTEIQGVESMTKADAGLSLNDAREVVGLPRPLGTVPDIVALGLVLGLNKKVLTKRLDVDKVDHEKLANGVREKPRDNLGGVEQLLGLVVTNDDGAGAVNEEVIPILECPVTKTDGG